MGPDFKPLQTEESQLEGDYESRNPNNKSSIGWYTPTMIVASFVAGIVSAVAHYLMFIKLDDSEEASTIRQSLVTSISTAIGRIFSVCVSFALGLSYTQILWNKLRSTSTRISTIDTLFSIQSSGTNLLRLDSLKVAPGLWFLGLFLLLVPLGTIFPPGAIVVVPAPDPQSYTMSLPTYDFDYRGNSTSFSNLASHALFTLSSDLQFTSPQPALSRIAQASALQGTYLMIPSPCGSNCSYTISMPGPEFVCGPIIPNTTPAEPSMAFNASASSDDDFVFMVQWVSNGIDPVGDGHVSSYNSMNCTVYYSDYTLSMDYTNGLQSTSINKTTGNILNSSSLVHDAFYPTCRADPCPPKDFPDDLTMVYSGQNVSTIYRESNVRAVYEAVASAFSGTVIGFDTDDPRTTQTIILDTPLAGFWFNTSNLAISLYLTLNATVLQTYLENTIISMLTLSNQNVSTMITTNQYVNHYSFASPARLVIPYAVTLLVALVFIVFGIFAMVQNGVSASSGGFIQLLCTTKGSQTLDDMTLENSFGGDSVSDDLKNLVVKYGQLKNKDVARAGFGVPGEVEDFVKNRSRKG